MSYPILISHAPLGLVAGGHTNTYQATKGSYVCWFRENQHDFLPARNFGSMVVVFWMDFLLQCCCEIDISDSALLDPKFAGS
jgi:hypothetical protein